MFLVTIKEPQWSSQAPHQNRPDRPREFVDLGSILRIVQDVHQLRQLLEAVEAMIPHAFALAPTLDAAQVTVAMTQVDRVWEQLFPAEQQRLIWLQVERVIVTPTNPELLLRPGGVGSLAVDARQAV